MKKTNSLRISNWGLYNCTYLYDNPLDAYEGDYDAMLNPY